MIEGSAQELQQIACRVTILLGDFLFDLLVARQTMPITYLVRAEETWVRDYLHATDHFFFDHRGGREWLQQLIQSWPDGEYRSMMLRTFPFLENLREDD